MTKLRAVPPTYGSDDDSYSRDYRGLWIAFGTMVLGGVIAGICVYLVLAYGNSRAEAVYTNIEEARVGVVVRVDTQLSQMQFKLETNIPTTYRLTEECTKALVTAANSRVRIFGHTQENGEFVVFRAYGQPTPVTTMRQLC